MALDDDKGKVVAAAQPAPAGHLRGAPRVGCSRFYLGGFVLVCIGERVLSGLEKGAGFVTLIGVLSVLAGTAFQFFASLPERRRAPLDRALARRALGRRPGRPRALFRVHERRGRAPRHREARGRGAGQGHRPPDGRVGSRS